jgi:hypothetical protein
MKDKNSNTPGKKPFKNPFIKALEDKKRIREAIWNGQDPSTLKDIRFVPYIRSHSK